jgi:hypothetical protein
VNGTGAAGAIVEAQVTDVVAVETDYQAGTSQVVGVAAEPTGDVVRGRGVAEIGVSLGTFETRLVSCDASPLTGGDGALDTGLPGEGYDVVVVAEVRVDEGDTMTTVTYAGHLGALPDPPELPESEVPDPNGEPNGGWQYRTLTVGTPLRLGPEETVHLSCGTPASTEPLRYDAAPEVTLTGTGFRDGAELIAQMTLTNTGDTPLREVNLEYPDVTVSSNGSVVGSAYGHLVDFKLPRLLQPGESVQLEMSLGQSTCALAGSEPWPAGTYELQAGASLLVTRDVAESGIAGYEVRTTFTLD